MSRFSIRLGSGVAPLHRRTVLRGAGGLALGLPFLDAMTPRRARAATVFPTRLVIFFSANGTIHEAWRPTGTETNFALSTILKPLEKHKTKLNILDGIAAASRQHGPGGNGHDKGMGHMLTAHELVVGPSGVGEFSHLPDGSVGGPSIDQEVVKRMKPNTRFPSLEFGVQSRLDTARQLTSRMIYRDKFQVVHPENDPRQMWNSLFSQFDGNAAALAKLAANRKRILDGVLGDFSSLRTRLPAADQRKLDSHATAIAELETSLQRGFSSDPLAACAKPAQPAAQDALKSSNYAGVGTAQMDLMTMALACDLTRVVSLQWSTAQSGASFPSLGNPGSHHGLSHEANDLPASRKALIDINVWYAQQFAYLLDKLAAVPEGDATLLDHSLVLWVNEQGDGQTHSFNDIPYVIAGSAGGALRTGRYLKFNKHPHNDLYISVLHAMGFPEATTFGLPQLAKGPLPGL